MKIKRDFVTNSSSASFILFIESTTSDLEEFEELFQKFMQFFLDHMDGRKDVHFWNPASIERVDVEHAGANVFMVKDSISMFNNQYDVPRYMRWLIMEHAIYGEMPQYGIKTLKLKVEEHG